MKSNLKRLKQKARIAKKTGANITKKSNKIKSQLLKETLLSL